MRLKDPFQGIKMGQGHIVYHGTFFLAELLLVDKDEEIKEGSKYKDMYEH